MDQKLQRTSDLIQANQQLSEEEKEGLLNSLKGVDKELQILAFKLDRTEKVKRTTAILLEETIEELEQKRKDVEETLAELKATQAQLVHTEKMASLGELTAGIAHEIQNPLNFVNNFSEVSKELLEEMLEELKNGDDEEVEAIAADVIQNLEKIAHHGKRADSIVKGMLQHSRSSDGKKEQFDINTLVDEYLRLAYHGIRAQNTGFNASLVSDYDGAAGMLSAVPQEIGRVVLNILTNAFHAMSDKKNEMPEAYQPEVKVQTHKTANGIRITIADNGNGIPEDIRDKIFQPFFTTKATGKGTGLGLSLSYDIIKAHNGTIEVKSEEGLGTEFIINLPQP